MEFPIDVLSHVLSFVNLGDILNVMCVNKTWLSASKKWVFWKQHVVRTLKTAIVIFELVNQICLKPCIKSKVLNSFNPFAFKEYRNRPNLLLGFCFESVNLCVEIDSVNDLVVSFKSKLDYCRRVIFFFDFNHDQIKTESYEVLGKKFHGIYTLRFISGKPKGAIHWQVSKYEMGKHTNTTALYTCDSGDTFTGNLYCCKPHGKGQWIFTDGTTLTGDNVAFDGLPHGKGQPGENTYFAGERLSNKRHKRGF